MSYAVHLLPEEDGRYVAVVPALPGCVSQGDTREEVLANIREAMAAYLEDCQAAGETKEAGYARHTLPPRYTYQSAWSWLSHLSIVHV